jgi:hypothetical protein
VSTEEGEAKAREKGAIFIEVSAKEGLNIKPLFRSIAQELPGMKDVPLANSSEFGADVHQLDPKKHEEKPKVNKCKC